MANSGSSSASGNYSGSFAGKGSYGLSIAGETCTIQAGYSKDISFDALMEYSRQIKKSLDDSSHYSGKGKAYQIKDITSMIQSSFRGKGVYDSSNAGMRTGKLENRLTKFNKEGIARGLYN